MMVLLSLFLSAHAGTLEVTEAYIHARTTEQLVLHLENKGTGFRKLMEIHPKFGCAGVKDIEGFSELKSQNQHLLSEVESGGDDWMDTKHYTTESSVLSSERAAEYLKERLHFVRLGLFGRLSKLAPGCLNFFRETTSEALDSKSLGRLTLEQSKKYGSMGFCEVTVEYWQRLYAGLLDQLPACSLTAED